MDDKPIHGRETHVKENYLCYMAVPLLCDKDGARLAIMGGMLLRRAASMHQVSGGLLSQRSHM